MATFFEDLTVGDAAAFGRHRVTEEAVVEFAERYDPQWFHTDPERAAASTFGGVIASGWHTASMTMRMLVEEYLTDLATLGAKGVDELRWPRPVRPGDVLSVRTEVVEKIPETPERGTVRVRVEAETEDGETVMRYVALVMVARRGEEE